MRLRCKRCLSSIMIVVAICVLCSHLSAVWTEPFRVGEERPLLITQEEHGPEATQKPPQTQRPVTPLHVKVQERCQKILGNTNLPSRPLGFVNQPLISFEKRLMYCPLAKAGSTFFTRYMIALQSPGAVMRSPFDIDIKDGSQTHLNKLRDVGSKTAQHRFLENSFKFIFTRDPYWRLFSTYIDKLYSPNPYYWKDWGIPAVLLSKLKPELYKCGSGVSFPVFVHLVVSKLYKKDLHFIPMTTMCNICQTKYDFVGKLEQAASEIENLTIQIKANPSFLHDKNYKMAASVDAINDSTGDSLHAWRSQVSHCTSPGEVGRLIWRRLQVRGIIQHDFLFPLTSQEMAAISAEEFRSLCVDAAKRSTDRRKLKRQKMAAFVEAYSQVSQEDMDRLKHIYAQDFDVLDYESDLSPLLMERNTSFENSSASDSDILNWRNDWNSV